VIATGFLIVVALAAVAYVIGVEATNTAAFSRNSSKKDLDQVDTRLEVRPHDAFRTACLAVVLANPLGSPEPKSPRIQVRPEVNTVTVTVTVEGKP
jgi:hypothetical protein